MLDSTLSAEREIDIWSANIGVKRHRQICRCRCCIKAKALCTWECLDSTNRLDDWIATQQIINGLLFKNVEQ